ncbi:MAG: hypothetical protein ACTTKL_00315 [Treponema sp.]
MTKPTVCITQEQLIKIETETHVEKRSLSTRAAEAITEKRKPLYPDGWADLFGSISDSSFCRPEQPNLETREPF